MLSKLSTYVSLWKETPLHLWRFRRLRRMLKNLPLDLSEGVFYNVSFLRDGVMEQDHLTFEILSFLSNCLLYSMQLWYIAFFLGVLLMSTISKYHVDQDLFKWRSCYIFKSFFYSSFSPSFANDIIDAKMVTSTEDIDRGCL